MPFRRIFISTHERLQIVGTGIPIFFFMKTLIPLVFVADNANKAKSLLVDPAQQRHFMRVT